MTILAGLLASLPAGMLVEYTLHRLMHKPWFPLLHGVHMKHHRSNDAQPLWLELRDYLPVAAIFAPFGLLGGWAFFAGWATGAVLYAVSVSVIHNMHHRFGSRFHELHHQRPDCNYGLTSGVLDWVFRTLGNPSLVLTSAPQGQPEESALTHS